MCLLVTGVLGLGGCSQRRTGQRTPPPPGAILAAPSPIEPADQALFTNYPRTVRFQWSAVPKAAGYGIEIDCYECCMPGKWCSEVQGNGFIASRISNTAYTFNFWGDQKGRWRVWGLDAHVQSGVKSDWRGFAFRTPPQNPSKPSPFGTRGAGGHA